MELIDASYSLTKDQKRILWLFLMGNNDEEEIDVDYDVGSMSFSLKAYATYYEVDNHEASRDILGALKGFNGEEVVFYLPEESTKDEKATDNMPWLAKRSYRPKRGQYEVYFNPYLVPYLKQMKEVVDPKFAEIDRLANPLHTRLYLKLFSCMKDREVIIDVQWIMERFKLPSTYSRYSNFKQRYLNSAIEAVKELEGMEDLSYVEIKSGRKVESIKFEW